MENEELISKKELLELTGISYGQLYRWKRKGLIPEDWFVRKSSYTGQETFFPRGKVLYRIEKIKNMKEDISLDDLADVFSPAQEEINLRPDEVAFRNIVSNEVLKMYHDYLCVSYTWAQMNVIAICCVLRTPWPAAADLPCVECTFSKQ